MHACVLISEMSDFRGYKCKGGVLFNEVKMHFRIRGEVVTGNSE